MKETILDNLSLEERYILEKIDRTRPECGKDNSKERYRYIQWMSCKEAVIEAILEYGLNKGEEIR